MRGRRKMSMTLQKWQVTVEWGEQINMGEDITALMISGLKTFGFL